MSLLVPTASTSSIRRSDSASEVTGIDLDTIKVADRKPISASNKPAFAASSAEVRTGVKSPAGSNSNSVSVGGVTLTKYPSQIDLSTVRTGAAYPAAAINKLNPTVYVIDNFTIRDGSVGSGAKRVKISHGDHCASIIRAGLPNVKVVELEAGTLSGQVNLSGAGRRVDEVIAREAKLQGTSKPDLSRVFISMSLGDASSSGASTPDKSVSDPITRFVQLGGTIYASAGNDRVNTTGKIPGVGFVYATQAVVGSTLSQNPRPAESLASGVSKAGGVSVSTIRSNPLDASSHAYVGAGTVAQRFNPITQGVENQNAQGKWVPAIAANLVSPAPVSGMETTGPLNNLKPSRVVTAGDAAKFDAWRAAQDKAACAKHKMPLGSKRVATLSDLSTAELTSLESKAKLEFRSRFGATSVMTVANFEAAAGISQASDRRVWLAQMLPVGLNATTTYIPAEGALMNTNKPDAGETHFYRRDASGVMKHSVSYSSGSVSTSTATPDVVVRAVQDRAERLVNAQAARPSFGH
jgi:hypothetical protein